MAAAALVNAGPLAAKLLADGTQSTIVSEFSYAVLVARVPLFMFQAVQAALLPKLARLSAQGLYDDFRQGFRRLMQVVISSGWSASSWPRPSAPPCSRSCSTPRSAGGP